MLKNKLKTLIIGLDGASLDLIYDWINNNELPVLNKLIQNGCWGELKSVFPPITAPAWSSFITGKNPGKHGIYDFLYRQENKYTTLPNSRMTRKSQDFWHIFNKASWSTGLINIPMTYPPEKINGYMITGIMTPRYSNLDKINYTYPQSLKYEIEKNIGKYSIHPKAVYKKGQSQKVYDDLVNDLHIKSKTIQYLIKTYPTDLAMFVIGGTDKIQHDLYHLIDKNHFRYDKEEAEKDSHFILDYYKKVDRELGKIMHKFCDEDSLIVVMSDHGHGPVYKWIHINNWLLKRGYLVLKNRPLALLKRLMFNIGITPANIYQILLKFGFSKSKISFEARDRLISKFFLSWNDINWQKTRAYSSGNVGQIFINKYGREPQGIVKQSEYKNLKKEIENKLMKLYTRDGVRVIDRILDRGAEYNGEYMHNAPDIIFMPHKLEYQAIGTSGFISNKIIEPAFGNSGDHRMNGLLIIQGKGIKKAHKIKQAQIIDIIPNILFYHNLPIDKDMDGKILKQIYKSDFLKSKKIKYQSSTQIKKQKPEKPYSKKNTERIKKSLQDLGYF